jgi:hypothetical protein
MRVSNSVSGPDADGVPSKRVVKATWSRIVVVRVTMILI